MKAFAAVLIFASVALAQQSAAPTTRPQSRLSYSDQYSSLEDHNIFLKDRRTRRRDDRSSSTRPAQKTAEELLVVTGIVVEEGVYTAYVEDTDSHAVTKLSPGQRIARGTVGACDIDAVEYIRDGKSNWIQIGQDFTGKNSYAFAPATLSAFPSASASEPTTMPADLKGLNPNDPNLTTEQRMRLRRMLERNR